MDAPERSPEQGTIRRELAHGAAAGLTGEAGNDFRPLDPQVAKFRMGEIATLDSDGPTVVFPRSLSIAGTRPGGWNEVSSLGDWRTRGLFDPQCNAVIEMKLATN